eukprot:scaffold2173_cov250-Pinguiococcus_pyrenoidosus.AAC.3
MKKTRKTARKRHLVPWHGHAALGMLALGGHRRAGRHRQEADERYSAHLRYRRRRGKSAGTAALQKIARIRDRRKRLAAIGQTDRRRALGRTEGQLDSCNAKC